MQWDGNAGAGFTEGKPWIKINGNYKEVNVIKQQKDISSILNFYKRLIALRKNTLPLIYGDFKEILKDHEEVYCYLRSYGIESYLIIANFFSGSPNVSFPEELLGRDMEMVLSNYDSDVNGDERNIYLRPYEAIIFRFHG